jgi:hypothetical protein
MKNGLIIVLCFFFVSQSQAQVQIVSVDFSYDVFNTTGNMYLNTSESDNLIISERTEVDLSAGMPGVGLNYYRVINSWEKLNLGIEAGLGVSANFSDEVYDDPYYHFYERGKTVRYSISAPVHFVLKHGYKYDVNFSAIKLQPEFGAGFTYHSVSTTFEKGKMFGPSFFAGVRHKRYSLRLGLSLAKFRSYYRLTPDLERLKTKGPFSIKLNIGLFNSELKIDEYF